ncbi:hypothetical protein J1614_003493 [Plenodomus biglobosus]|nr:hypothetical protein J1614_003493 [Plenodomus biglobosus]
MKSTPLFGRDLDRSPCPRSDSGYAKVDQFQVVCGKVLYGEDFTQESATSLSDCITLCEANSDCKAVTFDSNSANGPNGCFLKNDIPAPVTRDPLSDSALLLPNDVQDDCSNLAKEVEVKGKRYGIHCGHDHAGHDLRSEHAKSMQQCVGLCSDNQDCTSVSFDPDMAVESMYWNCYLKSSSGLDNLSQAASSMHTAFAINMNSSDGTAASSSITPSSPSPSASGSIPSTRATLPPDTDAGPASSKAWIAGAVVGPVIGVALVALLYVLYKRRRRNRLEPEMKSELPSQHSYYAGRNEKDGTQTCSAPFYPPQELDDGTPGRRELAGHPVAQH